MKKIFALLPISLLLLLPAGASAESAAVGLEVDAETLYRDLEQPARLGITTQISSTESSILPMRRALLRLSREIQFRPGSMPICPDNKIGPPPINVSVPVAEAVSRCPDSIIGNGLALFQLAGINAPPYLRQGYIIIFNGGKINSGPSSGRARIKIYAYSYGTSAGIYTEGILQTSGEISFTIPRLTADSATTSLQLRLPGEEIAISDQAAPPGSVVPPGQNPSYVRVRCPEDFWSLRGEFLLGNRNNAGQPLLPEVETSAQTVLPCQGQAGQALLRGASAQYLGSKRGRARFLLQAENKGSANLSGAWKISLPGRSARRSIVLAPGARGSQMLVLAAKRGRQISVIELSSNAGKRVWKKKIFVR